MSGLARPWRARNRLATQHGGVGEPAIARSSITGRRRSIARVGTTRPQQAGPRSRLERIEQQMAASAVVTGSVSTAGTVAARIADTTVVAGGATTPTQVKPQAVASWVLRDVLRRRSIGGITTGQVALSRAGRVPARHGRSAIDRKARTLLGRAHQPRRDRQERLVSRPTMTQLAEPFEGARDLTEVSEWIDTRATERIGFGSVSGLH